MQHAASAPSSSVIQAAPTTRDLVRSAGEDGTLRPEFRGSLDAGVALYRHMLRLRLVSAKMVDLQRSGKIALHMSSIGEEGAVAGATMALETRDWIFPGGREWGAALVRGMPLADYVHHAFGTSLDRAKGHAAPDHAPGRAFHVGPVSGVVGAHVPQAVGFAWAAKIRREDTVALAMFGEGATSTGDFHNGLNFSGVFKAPVVLVCRNNGRAGTLPASRQTKSESFAVKASAYGIACAKVDGQDALAVFTTSRAAVLRAREGKGATLIEVVTEPVGGELEGGSTNPNLLALGDADPLVRLRRTLTAEGLLAETAEHTMVRDVRAEIDEAVRGAEAASPPARESLFEDVFKDVPPHLRAQMENVPWGK